MAFYATFDSSSFWGSCPNKGACASKSPSSSSPRALSSSFCRQECSCTDASFGGVFALNNLDDDSVETYTKGSVLARLNAFLTDSSATARSSCLATETTAGSGFVWTTQGGGSAAFISDGQLSLVVSGKVQGLVDDDDSDGLSAPERSAWSLLGLYYDHSASDVDVLTSEMRAGLASLGGSWAFVLQDRKRHRVIAARSVDGDSPMMWAETSSGCLMFSSTEDSALGGEAFTDFPAGALFVSNLSSNTLYDVAVKRACPGRLVSFDALPAGAMRRVRSRGVLARVNSGSDMRLVKTYAAGSLRTTPSLSELFGSANELSTVV